MHHRHRQREALADAQWQVGSGLVGIRLQAKTLHQFGNARTAPLIRQMEEPGVQIEVGAHGQFAIQREGLRHVADLFAGFQIARIDWLAEQFGHAFSRRQQAGQHFHRGRLAATVGAQEAENLPWLDLETDVVDRCKVTKTLRQIFCLDGKRIAIANAGWDDQFVMRLPARLG